MTLLVAFPTTIAQEIEYSKTTHAYIGAIPNPVGVNQQVLIHVGITDFLRLYHHGWEGLTVTVTKPDGQTETLGPFRTDATGGTGTIYTPTMAGTYTLQTHFPAQTYDWEGGISRVPFTGVVKYEASDSEVLELVVQQERVPEYQGHNLPTEYWTRPIDAQLWEWSTVAGNWVQEPPGLFAQNNDDAPETAHILWTKPFASGGLVGGDTGPQSMECGDAYEGKFEYSVIMNGILYYNRFAAVERGGGPQQGISAIDLHTGEELWFKNNTRVSFGQLFYWDSFNYHGVFAYLWELDTQTRSQSAGGTYNVYDAFTGEWVYSMTDVPSGNNIRGPNGEILRYIVNTRRGWMALWNSTICVNPQNYGDTINQPTWDGSWARNMARDGYDRVYPGERGIQWNVSIPTGLSGSDNAILSDRIIGTNAPGSLNIGIEANPIEMWAISLKPGQEGTLLWKQTWQPPAGDLTFGFGDASVDDGIFVMTATETREAFGFNIDTGAKIWGPSERLNYIGIYRLEVRIAYGKVIFAAAMGGEVKALNTNTGQTMWTYHPFDETREMLWANNWYSRPLIITDGKLYLGPTEHSPVDPKPRGAPFICLDLETGIPVWRADGLFRQTDWGGLGVIGDSIIATMDTYDQRIYAIGKGTSCLTVSVPEEAQPRTTPVMIKGMVTDVSPGTQDAGLKMRFPSGVPAIADQYMSEWMLYVYKQFERPADAMGVPVKIQIVDPAGVYAWIGTATSDAYGHYAYSFVPQMEGMYTIIATFDGSGAYFGAQEIAHLLVGPAATPSGSITPETPETPLITTEVAIIAAVSVVAVLGLIAFSILRKRK
jgi:outer membrane protein assembly factor BamB